MHTSPIAWNLRRAKVGDLVMYKDGYTHSKPKMSKVVRVTPYKEGISAGQARTVKLEDETLWTGDGEKWGNASGYKSSYRVRAYHVVDPVAYEREIEEAAEAKHREQRRVQTINDAELFKHYASDEEISTIRAMQRQMKIRQSMNAAVSYLRSLAGYPREEITP
jgi:hypothetical protein